MNDEDRIDGFTIFIMILLVIGIVSNIARVWGCIR